MKKLLLLLILVGLVPAGAQQSEVFTKHQNHNQVGILTGIPVSCPPGAGFVAPQWVTGTQYYSVLTSQLGNAWVSNVVGGTTFYYKNNSNSIGIETSGGVAPTCTTGTCSDGTILWKVFVNNNGQCGDDMAHYALPHLDFVSMYEPWGGDYGAANWNASPTLGIPTTSVGIETSDGPGNASAGYSYVNFDASITNGTTGIMDNPNFPANAKIGIILAPQNGNPGPNIYAPKYIYSQAYATSLGSAPQDAGSCGGFPIHLAAGGTAADGLYNINTTAQNDLATGVVGFMETPAKTAYTAFVANAVTHYNSLPYIDYLRVGVISGETFLQCYSQWTAAYTPQSVLRTAWVGFFTNVMTSVISAAPKYPVEIVTNCNNCTVNASAYDYTFADAIAASAESFSPPYALGGNGLGNGDITKFNSTACTAGNGITSDHAFIWKTYPDVIKIFQTLSFTDPTGAGTGSLDVILPWQQTLQRSCGAIRNPPAMYYEAFWQDLATAYCPNYINYATYGAAYRNAILNFRGRP